MRKQKQFLATLVLCLTALSVHGRPADSPRGVGARLRDRIVRIVRAVTLGDPLTPPIPASKP